MPTPDLTANCRLHGVSIFLSASVPSPERRDEYERIPEASLRIEEAVVSVARAIFMEGGTLVFGAHPSISPLVARVVGNYYLPAPAEVIHRQASADERQEPWRNPSLLIFQSRVWESYWAEATECLARHPLVSVEWTPVVGGETVDPKVTNRPQAPMSMESMRRTMIEQTSPVAMITIGGMKGVLDETRLFADIFPERPIYAFATTGGASALLPRQERLRDSLRVIDQDALNLVRNFWAHQENAEESGSPIATDERTFYVPYALVAQQIVAEIVKRASD